MTDQTTDTPAPEQATSSEAAPTDAANGDRSTKSFWVGVGIGSAALAAALLYAKRPRGKRRT
ncbi:MAG: hypothetical protein J0G94_03205 [Sphingomonadales bacterium]|nr:hypothetical protein [Sphingomonadales bacterium]